MVCELLKGRDRLCSLRPLDSAQDLEQGVLVQ